MTACGTSQSYRVTNTTVSENPARGRAPSGVVVFVDGSASRPPPVLTEGESPQPKTLSAVKVCHLLAVSWDERPTFRCARGFDVV